MLLLLDLQTLSSVPSLRPTLGSFCFHDFMHSFLCKHVVKRHTDAHSIQYLSQSLVARSIFCFVRRVQVLKVCCFVPVVSPEAGPAKGKLPCLICGKHDCGQTLRSQNNSSLITVGN